LILLRFRDWAARIAPSLVPPTLIGGGGSTSASYTALSKGPESESDEEALGGEAKELDDDSTNLGIIAITP
jgi:hypothetical protein